MNQISASQADLPATILAALSAQRDLYVQLAELARRQSEFVATGQSEELMTVLAARNRLIEQLAPLDARLAPYKGRWQEVLDAFAPADRDPAGALLRQVQQLLADILERDEADKQSLIRQRETVRLAIEQTVTGTQLNRAYGIRRRALVGGITG